MMTTTVMMMTMSVLIVIVVMASLTDARALARNAWRNPCHGSAAFPAVEGEEGIQVEEEEPPSVEEIREILLILERKAEKTRLNVIRVKNVIMEERIGSEMAEFLEKSKASFSEFPSLEPLVIIELSAVLRRTLQLLSRHYVLLDRAIRYEAIDEAVNPLSASLGRIQDAARDMACLALRAARRRSNAAASVLFPPGLDDIGLTYDRSTIDLYAHLGSAYRSWIDYVHLTHLDLDLAELRTLYARLVVNGDIGEGTQKTRFRRFS